MDVARARLTKARDLLAKGYCKDILAQDKRGRSVAANSPVAAQWCVLGALMAADSGELIVPQDAIADLIAPHLSAEWRARATKYGAMSTLVDYNNAHATTQSDMVALLDKTIAALP